MSSSFAGFIEWFTTGLGKTAKTRVVFVLGAPGAGKTTLCSLLQKEYNFIHLSPGNLLREEVDRGDSPESSMIKKHLDEGTLVPAELACRLLRSAMAKTSRDSRLFLIDGFPRNRESLNGWENEVGDSVKVDFVLLLEVEEDVLVERCLRRTGRSDDNLDTLKTRLRVYKEETMPLVTYFGSRNMLDTVYTGVSKECVLKSVINLLKDKKLLN